MKEAADYLKENIDPVTIRTGRIGEEDVLNCIRAVLADHTREMSDLYARVIEFNQESLKKLGELMLKIDQLKKPGLSGELGPG